MLITCPECRKQVSESASSCPKCGFLLNEATRQRLKAEAVHTNRTGLAVLSAVLLLLGSLCMVATLTSHAGSSIPASAAAQQRAYDKFAQGAHLSDADVDDLAGREIRVSGDTYRHGAWVVFCLSLLLFVLPGSGILVYLYRTGKEAAHGNRGQNKIW